MWFIGWNGEYSGYEDKDEAIAQAMRWAREDKEEVEIFYGERKGTVFPPMEPTINWY